MRLTVVGFHVEYFIHHKYYPKLNTVVWTLDYDRESDLGTANPPQGSRHLLPYHGSLLPSLLGRERLTAWGWVGGWLARQTTRWATGT